MTKWLCAVACFLITVPTYAGYYFQITDSDTGACAQGEGENGQSDGLDVWDQGFFENDAMNIAFVKTFGINAWDSDDTKLSIDTRSANLPQTWQGMIWRNDDFGWCAIGIFFSAEDQNLRLKFEAIALDNHQHCDPLVIPPGLGQHQMFLPLSLSGFEFRVKVDNVPESTSLLALGLPTTCCLLYKFRRPR